MRYCFGGRYLTLKRQEDFRYWIGPLLLLKSSLHVLMALTPWYRDVTIVSLHNYYCRSFIRVARHQSYHRWCIYLIHLCHRVSSVLDNKDPLSREVTSHMPLAPLSPLASRLMRRDDTRGRYPLTDGFLLFVRLIRAIFVDGRVYVRESLAKVASWNSCDNLVIIWQSLVSHFRTSAIKESR